MARVKGKSKVGARRRRAPMTGLPFRVMTPDGEELLEPYLLHIWGWTEERYFKEAPETRLAEFEDGELILHSPANPRHQRITRFLTILLQGFVGTRDLGEVLNGPGTVRFRPGLDYEPDIFFIPKDQFRRFSHIYFEGFTPLVVEVVSPSTRRHDLIRKANGYRKYGVQEYWAIAPEQQILYRHLLPVDSESPYEVTEHKEGRLESRAIPGFWIDISWLWQEPLPLEFDCLNQILGGG